MSTLTRKQREIAERHALLLDIGRRLVESEGYQNLSMDRIAEISEYSKGTVYQHFSCKEEVLIQLCNHNTLGLKKLFEKAATFEGKTRERMLSIFLAHEIFSELNPDCNELMQTLCGAGNKEKVTEESLELNNRLEFEVLAIVGSVVGEAVDAKELTLPEEINVSELVFGLWSIAYGGLQLRSFDLPLEQMGIRNPKLAIIGSIGAMLDGLGWKPLSSEQNYLTTIDKIHETVLKEEYMRLHSGRNSTKQN